MIDLPFNEHFLVRWADLVDIVIQKFLGTHQKLFQFWVHSIVVVDIHGENFVQVCMRRKSQAPFLYIGRL